MNVHETKKRIDYNEKEKQIKKNQRNQQNEQVK